MLVHVRTEGIKYYKTIQKNKPFIERNILQIKGGGMKRKKEAKEGRKKLQGLAFWPAYVMSTK